MLRWWQGRSRGLCTLTVELFEQSLLKGDRQEAFRYLAKQPPELRTDAVWTGFLTLHVPYPPKEFEQALLEVPDSVAKSRDAFNLRLANLLANDVDPAELLASSSQPPDSFSYQLLLESAVLRCIDPSTRSHENYEKVRGIYNLLFAKRKDELRRRLFGAQTEKQLESLLESQKSAVLDRSLATKCFQTALAFDDLSFAAQLLADGILDPDASPESCADFIHCHRILIDLCFSRGDVAGAVACFVGHDKHQLMDDLRSSPRLMSPILESFLIGCCKHGCAELALRVVEEMRLANVEPTTATAYFLVSHLPLDGAMQAALAFTKHRTRLCAPFLYLFRRLLLAVAEGHAHSKPVVGDDLDASLQQHQQQRESKEEEEEEDELNEGEEDEGDEAGGYLGTPGLAGDSLRRLEAARSIYRLLLPLRADQVGGAKDSASGALYAVPSTEHHLDFVKVLCLSGRVFESIELLQHLLLINAIELDQHSLQFLMGVFSQIPSTFPFAYRCLRILVEVVGVSPTATAAATAAAAAAAEPQGSAGEATRSLETATNRVFDCYRRHLLQHASAQAKSSAAAAAAQAQHGRAASVSGTSLRRLVDFHRRYFASLGLSMDVPNWSTWFLSSCALRDVDSILYFYSCHGDLETEPELDAQISLHDALVGLSVVLESGEGPAEEKQADAAAAATAAACRLVERKAQGRSFREMARRASSLGLSKVLSHLTHMPRKGPLQVGPAPSGSPKPNQ